MSTSHSSDGQIPVFWQWFIDNATALEARTPKSEIINDLDRRVHELAEGRLAWEIGPGAERPCSLTISPGGNKSLLPLTREIVSLAPKLPRWEIHHAKPPKDWNYIFEMQLSNSNVVTVDARKWRYVLLRFPDFMYDVILETHGGEQLPTEDRERAGEILIEGILGEEARLTQVVSVQVLNRFDAEHDQKAGSIRFLSDHFKELSVTNTSP
jgi:hypothetical protein